MCFYSYSAWKQHLGYQVSGFGLVYSCFLCSHVYCLTLLNLLPDYWFSCSTCHPSFPRVSIYSPSAFCPVLVCHQMCPLVCPASMVSLMLLFLFIYYSIKPFSIQYLSNWINNYLNKFDLLFLGKLAYKMLV